MRKRELTRFQIAYGLSAQTLCGYYDDYLSKKRGKLPRIREVPQVKLKKLRIEKEHIKEGRQSLPNERNSHSEHQFLFKSADKLPNIKRCNKLQLSPFCLSHKTFDIANESAVRCVASSQKCGTIRSPDVQRRIKFSSRIGSERNLRLGAKIVQDFSIALNNQIAQLNHKIDRMLKKGGAKERHVRFALNNQVIQESGISFEVQGDIA